MLWFHSIANKDLAKKWLLPHIYDYWNESTKAIARFSRAIEVTDPNRRKTALDVISQSVLKHVGVLTDKELCIAAFAAAEDLYKAACADGAWDEHTADYLSASAGVFFDALKNRGYTVHYYIDNHFRRYQLREAFFLYPKWFSVSGLMFICPQYTAFRIIQTICKLEDSEMNMRYYQKFLPEYYQDGRIIAEGLLARWHMDNQNYIYLDADSDEEFEQRYEKICNQPGVIAMLRNEAPAQGSKCLVRYPEFK